MPEQTTLIDNSCESCGTTAELFHNDRYGGALCESCDSQHQLTECGHCGAEHDSDEAAYDCCRYHCASCGTEYRYEDSALECCMYSCQSCGLDYSDEDDALECCRTEYHGSVPALSPREHLQITVPVIEGRPARVCSLEQELADGGGVVAQLLYEEGVCSASYVQGYHSRGDGPGTIHVEEDSSLPSGGGEVVYDRFNLANPEHSAKLSRIVGKIRQLRDEAGLVKTSFAAGIHLHVSATAEDGSRLGLRDATALYELWCYAEDMLYSLSAAGWNRHRQPNDHSGYCKAVPKVEGTLSAFKMHRAMRADRYFGLNMTRLLNAASRCSCGAATMGDWEGCDCGAFNGATVEWRVFNSSTLPRTIHAWIVLAQAIVAHAKRHEVGTLPVNAYGSQSPAEKREVLEHLLDVLPLTEGEKDLIADAARRSPGL